MVAYFQKNKPAETAANFTGAFTGTTIAAKKANNKQDYDAIADVIFRLRDQKEQSEVDSHHREETMNRIKELQDFIAGQETDITGFDEALVRKLIEKITVFADHFTVEFKSGVTIDIEA